MSSFSVIKLSLEMQQFPQDCPQLTYYNTPGEGLQLPVVSEDSLESLNHLGVLVGESREIQSYEHIFDPKITQTKPRAHAVRNNVCHPYSTYIQPNFTQIAVNRITEDGLPKVQLDKQVGEPILQRRNEPRRRRRQLVNFMDDGVSVQQKGSEAKQKVPPLVEEVRPQKFWDRVFPSIELPYSSLSAPLGGICWAHQQFPTCC